jgi:hypothetical protein
MRTLYTSSVFFSRYSKPITPLENRICEKCFLDEIESEEHLLLKCSFYYTSRRKLLETIKNNINHSNFEKLSFGDKLRCSSDSISSKKHFSQMRFSKGVIGFEYLPVSIFNLWLLILNLVKDFFD